MILFLILFNVLIIATFACLIKPSLLSNLIGGEPWSRWIFLVLLIVVVQVKLMVFTDTPATNVTSSTQKSNQIQTDVSNYNNKQSLSTEPNVSDEIPTAPAATIDVEDNKAAEL